MAIYNPYFKSTSGLQHQVFIGNLPVLPASSANFTVWTTGTPAVGQYGLFQKNLAGTSPYGDTTLPIDPSGSTLIANKTIPVYFSNCSTAPSGSNGAITPLSISFIPNNIKSIYVTRGQQSAIQQSLILWDSTSGQPPVDSYLNFTITETTWATTPKPAWEFQAGFPTITSPAPQTALARMQAALKSIVAKINTAASVGSSPSSFTEVNTFFTATYVEITVPVATTPTATNIILPGIVITSTDATRIFDFNLWSSLSSQTGFGGSGDTYIKIFTTSDYTGTNIVYNSITTALTAGTFTTGTFTSTSFVFGNSGAGLPYQVQQMQLDMTYLKGVSNYYPSAGTRPEEWGVPTDIVAALSSVTLYDVVSIVYPVLEPTPVISGTQLNRYIDIFVPAKTGVIGSATDYANGIYKAFIGANSPL